MSKADPGGRTAPCRRRKHRRAVPRRAPLFAVGLLLLSVASAAQAEPQASVDSIDLIAAEAGDEVSTTFTVSGGPIMLGSDIGTVAPTFIEAESGSATFSFTVPASAEQGQSFTGGIQLMDSQENTVVIPVTVTVQVETNLSEREDLTERQREVAGALDGACAAVLAIPEGSRTGGEQDLATTCSAAQSASDPGSLLDGLAPEEIASQGRFGLQSMRSQMQNIGTRLSRLRAGAGGFDVSGLALRVDGQSVPRSLAGAALGGAAGGFADFSRWGAFVNGGASDGSRDGTDNESGFDYSAWDLTAGADYRFSPNLFAGLSLGYTRSDSDLNDRAGGVDVTGYSASVFGTYYLPSNFYVDAIATVGRNEYDTVRRFALGPVAQGAEGRPDGREYALGVNAGYNITDGPWTLAFQGSMDYVNVRIAAYDESPTDPGAPGSGSLLAIERQRVESFTTEVAVQATYAWPVPFGVLLPTARLGWEHQHADDGRLITASFLNDPGTTRFSVRTDDPDRDYFNVGLGMSAQFTHGRSAFIFFESVEGRRATSLYRIDVGFRMEF